MEPSGTSRDKEEAHHEHQQQAAPQGSVDRRAGRGRAAGRRGRPMTRREQLTVLGQWLGLGAADLQRHIAWDPGARITAQHLSQMLDAPLVCATLSRLLLDLNRPIEAADSITVHSEDTAIPGNIDLSDDERRHRHAWIYTPFHEAVAALLAQRRAAGLPTAVISIHSFTPRYHDIARPWHVGVLSQHDRRLADQLLAQFRADSALVVGDNQPYAPRDGVYHSMERHGEGNGLPCAMLGKPLQSP